MATSHLGLSYLCLSDDEEEGHRSKRDVVKGLPCNNRRCDQEPISVNDSEHYCSRECYQQKLEEDKLESRNRVDDKFRFKRVTIIGRGGTGLLKNRDELDFIQVRVHERLGRVVTVDNLSSECCTWKSKSATPIRKPKPKDKSPAQKQQEQEDKQRMKGLFACYSDSSESEEEDGRDNDEDNEDEEEAMEEIHQTIFCRGVNSRICRVPQPLPSLTGKPVKGYIINIVSPWELYIQTGQMILKSHEIDAICNREEGIDSRLVVQNWRPEIGGFCCAKYEDKFYRAKILEHVKDSFRVKYVDYGNIDLVPVKEVYQLNPEITLIPRQCLYYKVSNAKPMKGKTRWSSEVKRFTIEHLDGSCVEMDVEAVERGVIHVGKVNVLSSLSGEVLGDFGDNLVNRKLAEPGSYYVS